jgi:hypothetical protein
MFGGGHAVMIAKKSSVGSFTARYGRGNSWGSIFFAGEMIVILQVGEQGPAVGTFKKETRVDAHG